MKGSREGKPLQMTVECAFCNGPKSAIDSLTNDMADRMDWLHNSLPDRMSIHRQGVRVWMNN